MQERTRAHEFARMTVFASMPAAGVLVLIAVAIWWAQPFHSFFGRRGPTDAVDFAVFYSAGKLVASGDGEEIYNPSALEQLQRDAHPGIREIDLPIPYLNPPFFALAVAPLSQLSFGRAFQVWSIFKLALLVLQSWMIWRITEGFERRWRLFAVGGVVSLMPVAFSLALGQFSLILATSWMGAYMLMRSGRDRAAGLALVPLLIKPELLVPLGLFLAWKRRGRVFSTLVPATIVLGIASVGVVGIRGAIDYPAFVLRTSSDGGSGINDAMMMGWNCLVTEALGDVHVWPTSLVLYTMYLVTLAGGAIVWWGRVDMRGERFPMQWMMLTLVTVLVDPHFYLQDITMVMTAGIAVVVSVRDPHMRYAAGAAWAMGWIVLALGLTPMRDWNLNIFTICMAMGVVGLLVDAAITNRSAVVAPVQDATSEMLVAA